MNMKSETSEMEVRNLFVLKETYIDTVDVLKDCNSMGQDVPSYVAEFDYENDNSNTPLVYSFFPLVPVFAKNKLVDDENKIGEY